MEDILSARQIGKRIKFELIEKNMKQRELSEITGLNPNTISNYLSGNRIPDTASIYKISKALNLSIEFILTGNETALGYDINEEEINIIKMYRLLPYDDKRKIEGILEFKIIENENKKNLSKE